MFDIRIICEVSLIKEYIALDNKVAQHSCCFERLVIKRGNKECMPLFMIAWIKKNK